MNIKVHKTQPDNLVHVKSPFDFLDVHLYEGDGITLREEAYVIPSPCGEWHEFLLSEASEWSNLEKYFKNKQLYKYDNRAGH